MTILEYKALSQLVFYSSFFLSIILTFVFYFLYRLFYTYVIKKMRFPKKIKTIDGFLYRSLPGVYVTQEELDDFNADYIHSNKERSIKLLEYRLSRLKDSSSN